MLRNIKKFLLFSLQLFGWAATRKWKLKVLSTRSAFNILTSPCGTTPCFTDENISFSGPQPKPPRTCTAAHNLCSYLELAKINENMLKIDWNEMYNQQEYFVGSQ